MFGSTFGHVVTQNLPVLSFQALEPPNTFQSIFNLAQGPPPPVFVQVPSSGQFALPNGVSARALPTTQHLSHVDAYNVTLQRELTSTISAEIFGNGLSRSTLDAASRVASGGSVGVAARVAGLCLGSPEMQAR